MDMRMLLQNMNTNFLFKSYFTIFDQTNKTNSMCILSFEVFNKKIQNHNIHESFQSRHIDENYQSLSFLCNMQGISSTTPKKDFFKIGSFSKKKKNMKNSITILKQLKARIEGLVCRNPTLKEV
jgi:hypothetical protein